MKKVTFVFILAALVLIALAIWIFSRSFELKLMDLINYGVIILLVAFALFFGYKKLVSARRGEPSEDELSKKVTQKTAALSYYISIYLWLAISYFSDKYRYETHTIIGVGIIGMAVIFAICWIIFNFIGIRNE